MKLLKKILIVIAVIIAIPLIIALFVKKEYAVSRQITINKPRQEVFDYLKFMKNQHNYNKWLMMDPNVKTELKGTDGTVGAVYAWEGNNDVGKGEQEIKGITDGENIQLELRFIKPFEGIGHASMTTEAVSENQTKIEWGMKGRSPYPFNIMNLCMNGMLGKDLESSLGKLKNALEGN